MQIKIVSQGRPIPGTLWDPNLLQVHQLCLQGREVAKKLILRQVSGVSWCFMLHPESSEGVNMIRDITMI